MRLANSDIPLRRLVDLLGKRGPVILLESQSADHPSGSKSFIAALPERELKIYGNRAAAAERSQKEDPWEAFREFYDRSGGWLFGYLGYDLKNNLEALESANPDPVGAPDLYLMYPGIVLEVDLDRNTTTLRKGSLPSDLPALNGDPHTKSVREFSVENVAPVTDREEYLRRIREAQYRIREGEFYEINLSHQMRGTLTGRAYSLYEAMRRRGPVPFGAYISFGDVRICCASPERFLARRGSRVFSQPIKGTIHRGSNAAEDERLKSWLRHSEKNRAENLMIVDLVRNDLGRIARKGTVKTTGLFEIQSFGTVHQMVSTVEAEAGDLHPADILRACFPMGSMTGAPKISAMNAIEELEDYRRGIYSGCIGYLEPGGDFDFNVVIRTAVIHNNELFYPVGGAITSDSDPEAEWEETLTKARALTEVAHTGVRTT